MVVNKRNNRNAKRGVINTAPVPTPIPAVISKSSVELEKQIEELNKVIQLQKEKLAKQKEQKLRYAKSDKGKEAQRRASKKYWAKKRSGNPVGRPKKNKS